ncbi:MAG TPA: NAD(P)/FAD-dependent oxidoreductase [Pirellulales bacterium]|jgi:flavin-dependent dehydrogenase|nr:NAD(P)/FAD-dependent oxidoreductase [Pirellulales bacterium]
MNDSYDCIVIGGGPAGSTAAALVAEAGRNTLLLEREKFPRFHVGESLMPESYWSFKRLGVLDKLKQGHFQRKFSVQFASHTGRESQPFYFSERDPRECSETWQVLRSELDEMLFKNAAEKGADCHDQTRVLDVLFDGRRATGVRIETADGQSRDIAARVVVDATGQQSIIANRMGIRQPNPKLKKAAIWHYYRNARRDSGRNEGATLVLYTNDKKAWFWYIPLHDNIVSIGVVADAAHLLKGRGTPDEVYFEEVEKCPALKARLADAELTSNVRVLREFSYTSSEAAGDGWVLIGDAYVFLDPIYSSGVFLALKSGEMAGDCIIDALKANDPSAARLGAWAKPFTDGVYWMSKLVYAFYNDSFSFGRFIKNYPHHVGNVTDLLVGKVFQPSAADVFKDMDPWIEQAAATKANPSEKTGEKPAEKPASAAAS